MHPHAKELPAHSIYPPSSASRWLNCTASVAEIAKLPPQPSSKWAQEGTDAHARAEKLVERYQLAPLPPEEQATGDVAVHKYYDYLCQFDHYDWRAETRVFFYRPTGYGTADFSAYHEKNHHLHVIDLKYGEHVAVYARENEQLMCYALGAIHTFGFTPKVITLHIHQPRRNHVDTWTCSRDTLRAFEKRMLLAIAEIEDNENVKYEASVKGCRWCPLKPVCTHYADRETNDRISVF